MKFVHTADWQIGMKMAGLGAAAARVREERLGAARRVMDAAMDNNVGFVLLCGDTFEDNGVDRVLVQTVADILASCQRPVYIIPGNHDPVAPGSVWEHPAWKSSANVRVLRDAAPIQLSEAVLYPCPAREKHSGADPTAWIPPERTGDTRIGLAHGTVAGVRQDEPDYPIPRDAAQRSGLDYLALGHWHSYVTYPAAGASLMAYSGTHETTRFGERDSGNALIVEIAGPGASPAISSVRTGGLAWRTIESESRERGDLVRLRRQIEDMHDAGTTLLDVHLTGLLMAGEHSEIAHIEQILASRFLWGRLDDSLLRPSPHDESWLSALPPGIIREAAERLRAAAGASGAPAEIAARALMVLYAITAEAGR